MKWKNFQQDNAGYFITTSTRNSVPLLNHPKAREIVYATLTYLKNKHQYKIIGYCLMPEHIHLIIQAEGKLDVSKVIGIFKRHTAKQIYHYFEDNQDNYWLELLKSGAYKGQEYAVWQEAFRSEVVYSDKFLLEKLNYLHNNPVRRRLVKDAVDWPHSSAAFYYLGKTGELEVQMLPLSVSA